MNRFFSKLNLHDIKINPEGNRFPPDADEHEDDHSPVQELESPVATAETETVEDETVENESVVEDAWQDNDPQIEAMSNGHHPETEPVVATDLPEIETHVIHEAPASNGHASHEDVAKSVGYFHDGEMIVAPGEVLKVSARSRPSAVAGAIAGVVREAGRAEVQAIGAGATNQAVKAVAIARDYLSETGIDAVCVPAFIDVTIENEDRTAIRLLVEPR